MTIVVVVSGLCLYTVNLLPAMSFVVLGTHFVYQILKPAQQKVSVLVCFTFQSMTHSS